MSENRQSEGHLFRCPFPSCTKECTTLYGLKVHYWRWHKPYCWVCGRYFSSREGLTRHAYECISKGVNVEAHKSVYWFSKVRQNRGMPTPLLEYFYEGRDNVLNNGGMKVEVL